MIKTPTVFVLGAGARFDYDFPLGKQLITDVVKTTRDVSDNNPLFRTMRQMGFEEDPLRDAMRKFNGALDATGHASIDAFLEASHDIPLFPEIGKAAIAMRLLPQEFAPEVLERGRANNWLRYLFEVISAGAPSLDKFIDGNAAAFITFNYDRTTEFLIYNLLLNSCPKESADRVEQAAARIPVIHMHGSLGPTSMRTEL